LVLGDILEYYISEDLAKQILKKVPYCLAISLIFYILGAGKFGPNAASDTLWIQGTSMVVFLVSTVVFLKTVNDPMKNFFSKMDIKKLVGKLKSIYEEGDSLLSDIDTQKSRKLLISGFVSGVSLFVLFTSLTFSLIAYSKPDSEVLEVSVILVVIYLVYDVAKAPLMEEPQSESKFPLGQDLVEKYTVTNSLSRLPLESKGFLYVASRLIGPIVYINFPRLSFDSVLVYENSELDQLIRKFAEKSNDREISLRYEAGESLDQFFVDQQGTKLITAMVEESPKKLFPYLVDPESLATGKGWTALAIVNAKSGIVAGHVWISKFKGVYLKTKIKLDRPRQDPKFIRAFQFIFIGERPDVQYIKNQIELNTAKVPPNVMDKEFEP
jgi:hypothetical protein